MSPSATMGDEPKVANIAVINFERLLSKDAAEVSKLFTACADWGFFYLDLEGERTKEYLENVDSLFSAAKEYFGKPLEEKIKDTRKDIAVYNICG